MDYPKIVWEKEKKEVELLKKQLHELFKKDPKFVKKAALILERLLKEKSKP